MLASRTNRLDPSLVPEERIAELAAAFARPGHVALVDSQGNRTEIPEVVIEHFARLVRLMADRKAIVLIPEDETFTTQAAADYLGVSRQHLVGLVDSGRIPFHKVGSHRRVRFKDLLDFEKRRDRDRREGLDRVFDAVEAEGRYSADSPVE